MTRGWPSKNIPPLGRARIAARSRAVRVTQLWTFGAAFLLVSALGRGQSSVIVHEYIPQDAAEDLKLGVLTPSGKMPAVIKTPSGLVSAPDKLRGASDRPTPAYSSAPKSPSRFRIDGTTSDPGTLHYHEPFRPSIAPFKRLYTFDAVNDAFELYLRDSVREGVPLEGSPEAGEDEFFGDITVTSGNDVRIPSVSSKMRIIAADLEPPVPFRILVDRGENWFFQAPNLVGKARLIVRVASPRAALSPQIDTASFAELQPMLPAVPPSVARAVEPLFAHIGVSRAQTPSAAVRILVEYFRSFVPSQQGFTEDSGRALYEQLTLSRKGVCRHRAYAFVVTALVLGVPARFVHNEAHAWVEVYDGQLWHRVDLGGATSGLHYDGDKPEGPAYRMPKDNYPWPLLARPGEQLNPNHSGEASESGASPASDPTAGSAPSSGAGTSAGASAATPPEGNTAATMAASAGSASPSAANSKPPASNGSNASDSSNADDLASKVPEYGETSGEARGAPAKVAFNLVGKPTAHRGEPIAVQGRVTSEGTVCKQTRVDLELRKDAERYLLGSAATDEQGRFLLQATVPLQAGVGPYQVTATSADSAACSASGK